MVLRLLNALKFQIALTALAVAAGFVYTGDLSGALTVLLLGVFEISLSFDNAVVNAVVLQRMSPFWQRMFLVIGVPVAAIGMRFVFPILITSVASQIGFGTVVDLALHHPDLYQAKLVHAQIDINTLGGCFLGLVFLNFFLTPEEGQVAWLSWLEKPLAQLGKVDSLAVAIVLGVLIGDAMVVSPDQRVGMIISGLIAVLIYIIVNGLSELLGAAGDAVARAGLATFIYLEVLDASFSFDGVIGAFAITNRVILICLGLGIGALYIRTMTIYFVRNGILAEFVFLGNGAHWAIGALATILFIDNRFEIPEVITGLVGVAVIIASVLASIVHRRRHPADPAPSSDALGPTSEGISA